MPSSLLPFPALTRLVGCALLAMLLLLTACDRQASAPPAPPAPARPPMRIAQSYWPGQYWTDIAFDQGWFQAAGLAAVGVDTNPDFVGSQRDVVKGKLDCQNFSVFDLMHHNLQGAELVLVINSDYSAGADGIAARPGLETLADLKGRKIGLPKQTIYEFFLRVALASEGIPESAIEIVDMQGEKATPTLVAGAVDAVLSFEPFLSEAVTAVKGRLLWDTRQVPGLGAQGVTLRRQFLRERPDDVQKLVAVWQRATAFIAENPNKAYAIVARVNKVKPEDVRAFAEKDKVLGLRENLTAFSYASGFDSLHGTARVMNDFLLKQNIATTRIDSADVLDPQFLRRLK